MHGHLTVEPQNVYRNSGVSVWEHIAFAELQKK